MTRPTDIRSRFPQASADFLARNNITTTAKTTPVKSKTTTTLAAHDPHDVTGSNHASKPRIRQDRSGLNKWEAEFHEYLVGTLTSFSRVTREGLGFRVGNGCVYWPDFIVHYNDGYEAYEVKGHMRDDAAVKIKVAARAFPSTTFFLVTKRAKKAGGGWDIQEVLP